MCLVLGAATGASTEAPVPTAKHAELLSAAGAVDAADCLRSGAAQRARTTSVAILAAAQNGTSDVLAPGKHVRR
jgi:hypothetical protein